MSVIQEVENELKVLLAKIEALFHKVKVAAAIAAGSTGSTGATGPAA